MFTRKQYMEGQCTHQEFYDQFVNDELLDIVEHHIGRARILASSDRSFNDIPLNKFDSLSEYVTTLALEVDLWCKALEYQRQTRKCGSLTYKTYPWSLSDNTCILKAACRHIRDNKATD